jgi:hypothetical protein
MGKKKKTKGTELKSITKISSADLIGHKLLSV